MMQSQTSSKHPGGDSMEVPYGLRVAPDHVHLEENPAEVEVMMAILEGLVADMSMAFIAADLNRRGLAMRDGGRWTQSAVFDLLPRLIEFGSRLFNRDEWTRRRRLLMERIEAQTRSGTT